MNYISIFLLLFIFSQQVEYPLKNGKPTSKGIEMYVTYNETKLISEFEHFVNDTIFDTYIYARKFTDSDTVDLGHFYLPNEIIITNLEQFDAYELFGFSKFKRVLLGGRESRIVKSTILHEIGHAYFYQMMIRMRMDNMEINKEYLNQRSYAGYDMSFGKEFIEEGTSQYLVWSMRECIMPKMFYKPDTVEDLLDPYNEYPVKYEYSVCYLRDFYDLHGIKEGMRILLSNSPPTYEEILHPKAFFDRLK